MLSIEEAKKPASKCTPEMAEIELSSDEPWDTIKAQFLVKIDTKLSPGNLDFNDYRVMYSIPRLLSKPGMQLSTSESYESLIKRVISTPNQNPIVNVTIEQKKGGGDKENKKDAPEAGGDEARTASKSSKKVSTLHSAYSWIADHF
jgi:hypothetical protein